MTILREIWAALCFIANPPKPDPKRHAIPPPKGWNCKEERIEESDFFQIQEGGFAVAYDGQMVYSKGKSVADQRAEKAFSEQEELTAKEQGALLEYKVSSRQTGLHNVQFARQVKAYMKSGKTDNEIAALTAKSPALVRQYRACLERAK